ncbi:MAG: hypothetical protein DRI70_02475 [Bacteroidetes bacterium]|nr:MAG: hypothetical protein DRI70_02475 [Bacteroidota bacterium]
MMIKIAKRNNETLEEKRICQTHFIKIIGVKINSNNCSKISKFKEISFVVLKKMEHIAPFS